MGRSPCCEKVGLKKGPWTPEEDQKLLLYIEEHGHGSWRALPAKAGLQRCGKSCRLRWTNYLRPDIKRGKFSLQEEQTIIQLHALLGNRWSAIATHLPKRTDNEIKNYWNTHLKKRLAKMGIDPVTHKPKSDALSSADGHTKNAANLSHMAQWESARLEAEARLARESKLRSAAATAVPSASSTDTSGAAHHFHVQALSTGNQLQPSCAQASPCLDVLRAWQVGGVSKRSGPQVVGGIDLESPTSTLSFSETGMPHSVTSSSLGLTEHATATVSRDGGRGEEAEAEHEESEWKSLGRPAMRAAADTKEKVIDSFGGFGGAMEHSIFAPDASWLQHEPTKQGSAISGHFGDGLMTEMLLENSNSSSESAGGVGDSGNADSCGGGDGGGHENEEESKSYWNSILNLVNSGSPSGSPSLF